MNVLLDKYETERIKASATIIVPPLCMGRIPTDAVLEAMGCDAYLFPEVGVFHKLNLLLNPGPVSDGEVVIHVFNLSNEPVKVRRGDCIARLVGL